MPSPKTRSRSAKIKLWFCTIILLAIALFSWIPVQRMFAIAALQNTLDRAWEISFNSDGRPTSLPEAADVKMYDWLGQIFSDTQGHDGTSPAHTRNRDTVYRERFRALFRGPIHTIHIYYPEAFRGDLGATLVSFPQLRRFSVYENDARFPTEVDWTLLCKRLRSLPDLEEIELGGEQLTDAAISPLAHHPSLHTISITYGRLTPASATIFAKIPNLKKLLIKDQIEGSEFGLSQESKDKIQAALPAVKVQFD